MARRESFFVVLFTAVFLYQGCAGTPSTPGPPKPGKLTITTGSPLTGGVVGTAYSVQFAATGGTTPYTWSLASGSALPAGLTLSSSGLLSGTPTAAATSTFSVTVTDSETAPATATQSFSVTIASTGGGALLSGNYTFEFSGFNTRGAVVVGGSFHADGAGNISVGVEDATTTTGHTNQAFTGTYTLGADNRGTLVFSSVAGSPTYAFAIDSTGAHGRLVEFDTSGSRGSGQLEKQSVTACSFNTITGEYAIGITGQSAAITGFTPGPVAMAGRFTATPPGTPSGQGSIANGELDANSPSSVPFVQETVFGTYQSTSQTARCTAVISPQSLPSMTFSVYPVSATEFFLVETDIVGPSTTPFLTVGTMIQQVGYPFASPAGAFTATSVGGLTGRFLTGSTYIPDMAIVSLSVTGLSGFSLSVVENQGGTVANLNGGAANFVNADMYGRVATDLLTPIDPVFYMINQNEAFVVGEIFNNPFFGILQPQSGGPFTAANIKGSFVEGTSFPAINAVRDISGVLSLDGVRTVSGTQDQSTTAANSPAQAVSGTYTVSNASSGFGSIALSSPANFSGAFYMISPTQFVLLSTTTGDANPVLIIGEQ
jgi:hypothetical protein